ncbi:HipA domain-containing protein, partial [Mycobacterium kansasii]|uniref:HipA domain-containing protein n=4 Tax=Mycobacterium TaxID=1763 RepID=UPI00115CEE9C
SIPTGGANTVTLLVISGKLSIPALGSLIIRGRVPHPRLAERARTPDPDGFRLALLQAVTFNVVIGNADAHSKNYSVMIDRDGSVSLAPIYDAAPVMYLDPAFKGTGHVINGKTGIDTIDVEDLIAEVTSWGMGERRAAAAVRSCMERVYSSVGRVALASETEQVRSNLERLWIRRSWPTAS